MSESESSRAALQRYTAFVDDVLRPQLKKTLAHRDALTQEINEYQELRELLQELATAAKPEEPLRPLLNIGERFFFRAKVTLTALIIVDIGLNFHVEMTVSEAQTFVQQHLLHLVAKKNKWQDKAREVSEHVNLAISSIQQLAALQ
ncbi:hypothetical protein PsorP6_003153 [Peronosclerospora sorghi]|uniref:Uncharacterized protein n=1 Tax=Peronosclerospora sorghi TaxID=230839 RepID=A0ACC0VNP7_9STRA|nr:hypothetical protein PsorP6_003153 [Peronosclerospora sorghi]